MCVLGFLIHSNGKQLHGLFVNRSRFPLSFAAKCCLGITVVLWPERWPLRGHGTPRRIPCGYHCNSLWRCAVSGRVNTIRVCFDSRRGVFCGIKFD